MPKNPWLASRRLSGDEYDAHYEREAAAGKDVHGEANFVGSYGVRSVIDAGCGTGRVGRELARRGLDVVGIDLDREMLATARRKAPGLPWLLADLATVRLARRYDACVMAGNVVIFLTPGSEARVLENVAWHLEPGGLLIAGFQLGRGMDLERYDVLCEAAGLRLHERFATWERGAWRARADYAVSVHRATA
ncbi:MAG TPA: class I SAM-dependent methyltransferase [Dehalococcoidia bacterium]|nr:class I SAM-dependent methyltransferase [Dehalococcoidia bacterium]